MWHGACVLQFMEAAGGVAGQRGSEFNKIVDELKPIAILTKRNKLTTGAVRRPAPFLVG